MPDEVKTLLYLPDQVNDVNFLSHKIQASLVDLELL